jgi:hypothetical protein
MVVGHPDDLLALGAMEEAHPVALGSRAFDLPI